MITNRPIKFEYHVNLIGHSSPGIKTNIKQHGTALTCFNHTPSCTVISIYSA